MLQPEHKAVLQNFTASHNGKPLNQKAMLLPNQMVAKILIARLMHMTPEQQQSLKSIVTPGTADALKALLPELAELIDKGASNGTATG